MERFFGLIPLWIMFFSLVCMGLCLVQCHAFCKGTLTEAKEELLRKKRRIDFFLFLSFSLQQTSEIFNSAMEGSPYTFADILKTAVAVLFATWVMSLFFGIPLKILLKYRNLEKSGQPPLSKDPPPPPAS